MNGEKRWDKGGEKEKKHGKIWGRGGWGGINYQLCLNGKARENLAVETAFSCRKTYEKWRLCCWIENWPAGNIRKETLGIDRATQISHEMVCRCLFFRSRMVSLVFEEEFRIW